MNLTAVSATHWQRGDGAASKTELSEIGIGSYCRLLVGGCFVDAKVCGILPDGYEGRIIDAPHRGRRVTFKPDHVFGCV